MFHCFIASKELERDLVAIRRSQFHEQSSFTHLMNDLFVREDRSTSYGA